MSRPKSKATEGWAALLQAEVKKRGTVWTPEHKTLKELQALCKSVGLPCGGSAVRSWVRAQVKAGTIKAVRGTRLNPKGKLTVDVRYLKA